MLAVESGSCFFSAFSAPLRRLSFRSPLENRSTPSSYSADHIRIPVSSPFFPFLFFLFLFFFFSISLTTEEFQQAGPVGDGMAFFFL